MEKKIPQIARKLGGSWIQSHSLLKSQFFMLQLLSCAFSSISGLFSSIFLTRYPAASYLSNISMNLGIGDILFVGIQGGNITGTLLSSLYHPRKARLLRILLMITSIIIGTFGFIGLVRAKPIGCVDLSGPFSQCTRYGVFQCKSTEE